jgi:hypothetical protein
MNRNKRKLIIMIIVAILFILVYAITAKLASAEVMECAGECKERPTVYEVCWSVTSYWPFILVDVETQEKLNFYEMTYDRIMYLIGAGMVEWIPVPFGGQADAFPTITGDGTCIDPYTANRSLVAGPIETYGRSFVFPWGEKLVQHDTFGLKMYQDGVFWHYYYDQFVIGVDVLSFEPVHYLMCEGEIK